MNRLKNALVGIAVIAILAAFYYLVPGVRQQVGVAVGYIANGDIQGLRDYLLSFGAWAPVVSALLMILQSVAAPLPAFVITFANGALFGPVWGTILSWSSAMAGAAICYGIAKALGRPAVEKLVGAGPLNTTDRFFKRYGAFAILLARLTPIISFDLVSYASGLTSVGFWQFMLATGVGQLPATVVYSYLGYRLGQEGQTILWVVAAVVGLLILAWTVKLLYERRLMGEEEAGA